MSLKLPKKRVEGPFEKFAKDESLPYIKKAKIKTADPDLFSAIIDIAAEIYGLLRDPFSRYKSTPEYKRIANPSQFDEVVAFKRKFKVEKDHDQYQSELQLAKVVADDTYWKIPVRRVPKEENSPFGGSLHHKIHGVAYDVFTRTYRPEIEGGFTWFMMRHLKKEFSIENGIFLCHISNLTTQTTLERVEAYFQRLCVGMIFRASAGMQINISSTNMKKAFAAYDKIVRKYTLVLDVPYNHQGHVHEVVGGKSKTQDNGIHVDSKRDKKFDRERAATMDEMEHQPFALDSYIESLGDTPEEAPTGDKSGIIGSIPKKPSKKKKETATLESKKSLKSKKTTGKVKVEQLID